MKPLHEDGTELAAPATLIDRVYELAIRLVEGMDTGLSERGLSRARAEVLLVLRTTGATTQRQLSEVLRCSPRNVTGLLDSLEAATLVERTPHPTDRRALLVRLTKKGTHLAARLRAEQARAGTTLFADVPRSDLLAFRAVIEHVITHLDSRSAATR